jgi:N-acetyl-anhydromuramyl-L-alanine amidase AmpD
MARVCIILALSLTAIAAACCMMMPRGTEPEPGGVPAVDGNLAEVRKLVALKNPAEARPWRYIVIHHSATTGGTVESITKGHLDRGFEEIGYHFLINNGQSQGTRNGEIAATIRWTQQMAGAHCKVADHPEFNDEGIGVCLVGDFELKPPTPEQLASLQMLIQAIRERHNIPIERVVGHRELKATKCPGRKFPMDQFLIDLRQAYLMDLHQADAMARAATPGPGPGGQP